jgi:hypothetical protein
MFKGESIIVEGGGLRVVKLKYSAYLMHAEFERT